MNNPSTSTTVSLAALFGPQCWFMLRDSPPGHMPISAQGVVMYGLAVQCMYCGMVDPNPSNGRFKVVIVNDTQDHRPTLYQVLWCLAGNPSTPNYC